MGRRRHHRGLGPIRCAACTTKLVSMASARSCLTCFGTYCVSCWDRHTRERCTLATWPTVGGVTEAIGQRVRQVSDGARQLPSNSAQLAAGLDVYDFDGPRAA
jgi:X-X-X-Leu-X-X-Gly heptad repeat protein